MHVRALAGAVSGRTVFTTTIISGSGCKNSQASPTQGDADYIVVSWRLNACRRRRIEAGRYPSSSVNMAPEPADICQANTMLQIRYVVLSIAAAKQGAAEMDGKQHKQFDLTRRNVLEGQLLLLQEEVAHPIGTPIAVVMVVAILFSVGENWGVWRSRTAV